jgi:hypothetical protein
MFPDDGGLLKGFFKSSRFEADPQELRDPLKLTSSVSLTVAAIHMVDGHEETKTALLKVPYGWRVGPHHHPLSHFDGARGNWFSHALDFHKAQPAGSGGCGHGKQRLG